MNKPCFALFALLALCAVFFAQPASAVAPAVTSADWTLGIAPILNHASSTGYSTSNGVGRPAVEWDAVNEQFIMVFEFRSPTVVNNALCPIGVWGLGIARSYDNATWVVDPTPLYVPTPGDGSYYSCAAAHASVIWSDESTDGISYGDDLRVYFKSLQGTDACALGIPPWGCNQPTGVGDFLVEMDLTAPLGTDSVESIDIALFPNWLNDQESGYSNVIERTTDGKLLMMWQQRAQDIARRWDIYLISSWSERGGWGTSYKVLQPDISRAWAKTEYLSPSMFCMPDGTLAGFLLGRTYTGGAITAVGWSTMTGLNSIAAGQPVQAGYVWTNATSAQQTSVSGTDYRHIAFLRDGTDDYIGWYTKQVGGKPEIWGTSTLGSSSAFVAADVVTNRCD